MAQVIQAVVVQAAFCNACKTLPPFLRYKVSVDYLIGKTKMVLDLDTMRRMGDISSLPEKNKNFLLNMIDMALRDFRTKKTYAK